MQNQQIRVYKNMIGLRALLIQKDAKPGSREISSVPSLRALLIQKDAKQAISLL